MPTDSITVPVAERNNTETNVTIKFKDSSGTANSLTLIGLPARLPGGGNFFPPAPSWGQSASFPPYVGGPAMLKK